MFTRRLVNRKVMPTKHVLVCEDMLLMQHKICNHLLNLFGNESAIELSLVSGGLPAKGVIENTKINLIILDHDMPSGSGPELLKWMNSNKYNIPVITFSGIHINNLHLHHIYTNSYISSKQDVLSGGKDILIKAMLGL